jgi:hypothetical protein
LKCAALLLCAWGLPAGAAQWITAPGAPRTEYVVAHFRRAFEVASPPASFVVKVSADNRYQLFLNGVPVSEGPARGDLLHWRRETVDLAPHLKAGRNVLAAVVWNFGAAAPLAQITNETGFLLEGDRAVETGRQWKGAVDGAYSPIEVRAGRDVAGYYAAGPGERVDGARYPWGWQSADFDDSGWAAAAPLDAAAMRGARDAHSPWMLVERTIPAMDEHDEPALQVRRATGAAPRGGFPREPWTIPARSETALVLDQGYYTTGYPELTVSGGRGSTVSLRYAESLFEPGTWNKGNRNQVEGKEFKGYRDVFLPDGGARRAWRPLWWRTWRYIELSVKTGEEPLTVERLAARFSGYPFTRRAELHAGGSADAELQRMLDVSWRTLRVDAHETFMDCAYYEQLQYIGDSRLEALAAMTLAGDARLVRNALEGTQATQTADGLTFSRGPSRLAQYIPPFSLIWIGMLHDYWMYTQDAEFVRGMLPATRSILSWFAARQKPDGALGPLEWWNFADWVKGWPAGVAPAGTDGNSALLDLEWLAAYQAAGEMERSLGSPALAGEYGERAERLRSGIRERYFDAARGLFRDTPEGGFSQHVNALAVLTGAARKEETPAIGRALMEDARLTQATLYLRYYVDTALFQAGFGDRFLERLGPWREALELGLTTWPETPEPSRSDAHAWSSHIAINFFRGMLGVSPAAAGFARIRVEPHLGALEELSGKMPHPRGEIAVRVARRGAGVEAEVTLPEGAGGEFVWAGQKRELQAGLNRVRM